MGGRIASLERKKQLVRTGESQENHTQSPQTHRQGRFLYPPFPPASKRVPLLRIRQWVTRVKKQKTKTKQKKKREREQKTGEEDKVAAVIR